MLSALRYVTFVLTFSVILTIYLTIFLLNEENVVTTNNNNNINNKVKNIVAFSLLKKIELESEEIVCENFLKENFSYYNSNNFNEKLNITTKMYNSTEENDNDRYVRNAWVKIPETNFYAYSVYLDKRLDPYHYLRIIGMVEGNWNKTLYCQIFSSNNKYQITKVIRTNIWSNTWTSSINQDNFNPVLLSCQVSSYIKPIKVSLSRKPCHYNNNNNKLIVNNYINKKKFITICIKPLNFNKDISSDLIQWLEINKILGADGIDIYMNNVHKNVKKILNWYNKNKKKKVRVFKYENVENYVNRFKKEESHVSFITRKRRNLFDDLIINKKGSVYNNNNKYLSVVVKNLTLPGGKIVVQEKGEQPVVNGFNDQQQTVIMNEENIRKTWQKRKNELITYNDCFYRNIHASTFVLPVDIDEIIVPKRTTRTWKELIIRTFKEKPEMDNYASLAVQNTYFLKRFPTRDRHESVFFFKYMSRTDFSTPGESVKSFISTKNALTVFNHYALDILRPGIRNVYFLSNDIIQMNHYRETCSVHLLPECVKYNLAKYEDTIITKYKNEFYFNYNKTMQKLNDFS